MEKSFKIGLRNIKTSFAVLICLIIGYVFGRNSFYSTIAAVICMQPTLSQTLQAGVNRVLGTVIGGAAGFLILELQGHLPGYYDWLYIIVVPLLIMLLIFLCNIFHIPGAISMCCVVFLGIATDFSKETTDTLLYVLNRILDTSIGIGVAMVVNRYHCPEGEDCGYTEAADTTEIEPNSPDNNSNGEREKN